nr:unnamed protein product [Spirometra erinaceieuropaei]
MMRRPSSSSSSSSSSFSSFSSYNYPMHSQNSGGRKREWDSCCVSLSTVVKLIHMSPLDPLDSGSSDIGAG